MTLTKNTARALTGGKDDLATQGWKGRHFKYTRKGEPTRHRCNILGRSWVITHWA